MSEKRRIRSKTIAFRMSEAEKIDFLSSKVKYEKELNDLW